MVGLGDLEGGDFTSYGAAISRDGGTIVGYGTSAAGLESCVWRNGVGPVSLGHLPGRVGLSRPGTQLA